MTTFLPTIPKVTLRALTELTGEPQIDVALLITLQDALKYRLEAIQDAIQKFEQKHEMSFEQFQEYGEMGQLSDQFSYEIESDYLEWEGLISRKKNLEKIGQWLI